MASDNNITHIEIPAPDLGKSTEFYSALFNWKIQVVHENMYAFFMSGDGKSGVDWMHP